MSGITELQFITETIHPELFVIEDVIGDNSCLYRCLSNIIYYYSGNDRINGVSLSNNKQVESFGFSSQKQEKFARELQSKIVQWLFNNRNKVVEEIGITVKEFIIQTHNLFDDYGYFEGQDEEDIYEYLMEEYLERYSKFAGDNLTEEYDRWGGAPEQYAISEIFKIPVFIYVYKKYNHKNNKIENGKIRNNKPEKGVRFKLYQSFGGKYQNNHNGIHLLYKNTSKCPGHYLCLYKK